ncbi:class I SAM-dependent methyltransferase [Streptomyces sp. NPDC057746]|uniref:class I SAM-dependent methyltransferase n=1 Tax=Streptomyces sp. NPDC057746 TaxID=3346237 RepID=UPI00367E3001
MIATALAGAKPRTREHVLAHLPAATAEPRPAKRASDPDVLTAQTQVLSVYFWEIIYRKHPQIYQLFSDCQAVPLHEAFPPRELAGKDVVDIGTGTAKVIGHLAPVVRRAWGFDPAGPLLDIARRAFQHQPHVSFDTGTFDDIPLPDSSADVVVSCFAYQPSEERGGLHGLAEIRRVLRPGGRAMIAVSNTRTEAFLRAHGMVERVTASPVVWSRPADAPPLLDRLFELAHVRFDGDGSPTAVGERLRVYDFPR